MITSPSSVRRSERSRRAILRSALDLCTERGYGHVTIEAIAAGAGVSKKTIYRWWPSKGAVLLEAFTDALIDATRSWTPAISAPTCAPMSPAR